MFRALRQIRIIRQDDNIRRDAINRTIRLVGQDWIKDVDDREVRLVTACFMVHAFRLFVPEMPFFCLDENGDDSHEKLAKNLIFIINQFSLINDEKFKDRAWYLVDHCKQVKLFNSVFAIEGKSEVMFFV